MRSNQIRTCAGNLPEPERQRFLDLHATATKLAGDAAELRAEAWNLYHSIVPPKPKPKQVQQ